MTAIETPSGDKPKILKVLELDGRVYEVVAFLKPSEKRANGYDIARRGSVMNAAMEQEDGDFLLRALSEKLIEDPNYQLGTALLFPNWRKPDALQAAAFLFQNDDIITLGYSVLDDWWYGNYALVRRVDQPKGGKHA